MKSQLQSKTQMVQTSFDGYIRMTFETFNQLKFIRQECWEDVSLGEELRQAGIEISCAGYCEWGTDSIHSVSIGWAWFDCPTGRRVIAPGGISTNVMFVASKSSYDLGQGKTGDLLQVWLSGQRWQIK